ncbi:BNR-4 repeat-containing protein [uncultured Aquimarina sp.]|uniref:BNR-4 repeat-containing protein n=1 Tax=uncultured Aquimarina sp. TaxID=575652 RepID=UPI002606F9D6|nr:BNR-4 repeat-containing protein [uncultured Aquimarina sp.]
MKYIYYRNVISFFIILNFLFLIKSYSQNLNRIQNVNVTGSELNIGDCTPVTTFNDAMYVAWIEGTTLKVSKKLSNGSSITNIVRRNIQNDKYHVMPSIAVDKTGYIHITADVHNQDWVYYISNNPESIDAFTKHNPGSISCPPGEEITYPEFFKDVNDELYITYRHQTKYNGDVPGKMGGAIAKYNVQSKSWTMLGGTSHGGSKTMVWANGGANKKGFYQKPLIRLFWDRTNRIHLVTTIAVENAPNRTNNGMTDVLYAYSDDGGFTWKKANRSSINSLPLTRNNASVIANRSSQKDIISGARIVAFDRNKPVVSYQIGEGSNKQLFMKTWNGNSWKELNAPYKATAFYGRRNGEVVVFRPYNGWYITKDEGKSWQNMRSNPSSYNGTSDQVDYEYYLTTGDFRWRTVDRNSDKVTIYTYDRNEESEEINIPVFEIKEYTGPSTVVAGQSYSVNIPYNVSEPADLILTIQNRDDSFRNAGFARVLVSENGTAKVNIQIDSDSKLGNNYVWKAYLTTRGGNWSNRHIVRSIYDITYSVSQSFSIKNYLPPNHVRPGETYTINIPYTGTGTADVKISLQNKDENWETEGSARLAVNGNGTVSLNVTVDRDAKLGNNYIWQAYIGPSGGNWNSRYDSKSVNDISCSFNLRTVSNLLELQTKNQKLPNISDKINFYPNPVNNQLILKSSSSLKDIQSIKIYDIQGKLVKKMTKNKLELNTQRSIDVSGIGNGLYILSIDLITGETENSQFVIKH